MAVNRIEPGVPPSLQEMLNEQFDRLTEAEQRALKKASAIGERFPTRAVAAWPDESDDVEQICEGLAERRSFVRAAGLGELAGGTTSAYYEFHRSLSRAIQRAIPHTLRVAARNRRAVAIRNARPPIDGTLLPASMANASSSRRSRIA